MPAGATAPVVVGCISRDGERLILNYGHGDLDRDDRIPIYEPGLPLPLPGLVVARKASNGRNIVKKIGRFASVREADIAVESWSEFSGWSHSAAAHLGEGVF